jgi:hypothetical protein
MPRLIRSALVNVDVADAREKSVTQRARVSRTKVREEDMVDEERDRSEDCK